MKLFNFKKFEKLKLKTNRDSLADPYMNIGNIIKESRVKKNLSIDDLSYLSKIPSSTIVGIENNIKELIPQHPFTRSILLKLEECLSLEKFKHINLISLNFSRQRQSSNFNSMDLMKGYCGINSFILFSNPKIVDKGIFERDDKSSIDKFFLTLPSLIIFPIFI